MLQLWQWRTILALPLVAFLFKTGTQESGNSLKGVRLGGPSSLQGTARPWLVGAQLSLQCRQARSGSAAQCIGHQACAVYRDSAGEPEIC